MNVEQGTLFTDIITDVKGSSTEPAHYNNKKVHRGFDVGPTFNPDIQPDFIAEDDNNEKGITKTPARRYIDSHEVIRSIVGDISKARQLEGLVKSGVYSASIKKYAQQRGVSVSQAYADVGRRQNDLYNSARTNFEEWSRVGSAIIELIVGKETEELHFAQFEER